MATMTNPANSKSSLLIVSSLFARERIVHERVAALLRAAEHAQFSRDRARLTDLIAQLSKLPLNKQEQDCLGYYEAWQVMGDRPDYYQARLLSLAETAPFGYRIRSLLTAGCLSAYAGDLHDALRIHSVATVRANQAKDYTLSFLLRRNQASIVGLMGDQKRALRMLESLAPLARWVARIHPASAFEYLNALANEMAELGKLEEAHQIISIPTASPMVVRFPEWTETRSAINSKLLRPSRSIIAVSPGTMQLAAVPPAPAPAGLPARASNVSAFPDHRIRKPRNERLFLVANLVNVLIDRGAPESLLRFMNKLIEYGPSDDLVRRITALLDRDGSSARAERQ
jgi:hypothetical protein